MSAAATHHAVVEVLLHKVVERDADERRRQARKHDLAPERPRGAPALATLARAKRVELVEEQHAHPQGWAPSWITTRNMFMNSSLTFSLMNSSTKIMWPRARDGQPLGDALDQAEKCRFEQFDGDSTEPPLSRLPALDRAGRRLSCKPLSTSAKTPGGSMGYVHGNIRTIGADAGITSASRLLAAARRRTKRRLS